MKKTDDRYRIHRKDLTQASYALPEAALVMAALQTLFVAATAVHAQHHKHSNFNGADGEDFGLPKPNRSFKNERESMITKYQPHQPARVRIVM